MNASCKMDPIYTWVQKYYMCKGWYTNSLLYAVMTTYEGSYGFGATVVVNPRTVPPKYNIYVHSTYYVFYIHICEQRGQIMDISSPLSLAFSFTARCRTWHYNLLLSESRVSYNIMDTWCKRHLRDQKPRKINVHGHLYNITHFRSTRPINLFIFPNSIQQLLCVFTLLIFDWKI